ncbi:MYND finger family protein [Cryptosporidium meleagridis]|uniref:MYND finger family protein n=1 Tax=Cryptosporidium meleagridis TaxID=93969 RepID=A0A2P4YZQ2_9CRYT|nr:MYND finger family protein [Cryptosporidium meleagridis]
MDSLDEVIHEKFTYVFIPYHDSDKIEVREFSGKEVNFKNLMRSHFSSKLRSSEVSKLQETFNKESKASDQLVEQAILNSQNYEIISLVLPNKSNNFIATNAYIDSIGRIKEMPINPRASKICSTDVRGDCFISSSFDDEYVFKRVSFGEEEYNKLYKNPPSAENRWDASKISTMLNNPTDLLKSKEEDKILNRCESCRKESEQKLLICSRCKKVAYCNVDCQRKDWSYHKQFCK